MAHRNPNLTEEEKEQLLLFTENTFPEDNISDTDEDENDLEGRADGGVINEEVRAFGDGELEDLALQAEEDRYLESGDIPV